MGAFDIFIGEEEVLQQGLGSKAIVQLLKLHGNQYSYIFADPDINNLAAIKCYEKAGFKKLSEQQDTGEVWMLKDLSSINQQNNLFIVILSYKVPLEKIDAFRSDHLNFLSNCYTNDFFIVSGPQVPRNGGIIIAKCDSKDVLQKLLDQDPFSINDLATYEIIEFSPTKRSKEFESIIFAQGQEYYLNNILEELKIREPIFHHPEKFGKTKEDIERQMCDEFWEVGASGNVYTKQDVIKTLLERYNNPNYQDIWEAKDFAITKIAPDNYLLTYVLIQDKTRVTRRSTLWRKKNGDWKILYHQGTVYETNIALRSSSIRESILSHHKNAQQDTIPKFVVRTSQLSDIDAMVSLSKAKRLSYEKAQPQFWRYAGEGGDKAQGEWFKELLEDKNYVMFTATRHCEQSEAIQNGSPQSHSLLRDDNSEILGFIIGKLSIAPEVYNPGGLTLMIDDFCMKSENLWQSVGARLIEETKAAANARGATQILVVCGAADHPKRKFLSEQNLQVASEWFVGGIV